MPPPSPCPRPVTTLETAARRPAADPIARASARLAEALGLPRPAARAAGRRAARLWRRHLLAGADCDLSVALGRGIPSPLTGPVMLTDVGVHLVCPHHLTVAMGRADVAYLPAGHIAGLGRLARLAQAACARLILQEEAGQLVADVLLQGLGARASWVQIAASHPCVGMPAPRSHAASAITQATAGAPEAKAELLAWLRPLRDG